MSSSCETTVKNKRGIHARPSSEIAKTALKYQSEITIRYEDKTANAKDVLQLIMLELFEGSTVIIETEGEDEKEALKAVKELVEKEYYFD